LRWKFFALALVNLALLALTFLLFLRLQLREEMESFLMAAAREKIVSVSRQLTLDLDAAGAGDRDSLLQRYSEIYGVRFLLYRNNGSQIAGPPTALPDRVSGRMRRFVPLSLQPARPLPSTLRTPGPPPFLIAAGEPQQYWVGVRTFLPESGAPAAVPATLILWSPTLWTNPFFFEIRPWLAILAVALLVSLLCWLPLMRSLTRAVSEMMSATSAVAEGDFDVEVDTRRRDELGSLGKAINRMTERLRSYVHGQKRFLGDAAHELRSPLGRMQLALGILEGKVRPEDQSLIGDLKEEVDLMSGLTSGLLEFARAEMQPGVVQLTALNLKSIVEHAMDIEAGKETRIEVAIDPELQVLGEAKLLFHAFSNLIRNAVRYAGSEGPIVITARRQGSQVAVTVADSGPGVPEEALEKIFTPFFRLESARDRKTGGSGLGLAIVRSSVEACHGAVAARNRRPHGLEVTVTLQAK
jgi:two-component system sensor histidine kinase CpxA